MTRKLLGILLFYALCMPLTAQDLKHKMDSLALSVSRTVQMEDGTADTVSCSRYHHFIWFDETSETAKKLNQQLYESLSEKPLESVAELKEILTADFNDWAEEWQSQFVAEDSSPIDFSFNLNWYEEIYTGITHQTSSLICTYQSVDGFYGGAHPIGSSSHQVYKLPEAEQVQNWQDLFTDTLQILKMAEESFRKDKGLSPKTKLEDAGYWFNNNRFHLTNNFGLDSDGIFFLFNAYEVASYAEGPIYISVPYVRLKKYLKKPL